MRPGMGHSLMPSLRTISRCRLTNADEKPWNDENMKSEKAGKRGARDDRAAEKKMNGPRADNGNAAGDRSANAQAPKRVLIESQNLAGERHAQSHEKQKDADNPGKFTGKFICAEKKNLDHVNQNDGNHEVGAPTMERADVPTEGDGMIEGLQAVPGFAGGRHVDNGQQNAGDNLHDEDDEGGAAKDVKPTGRFSRHSMFRGFANGGPANCRRASNHSPILRIKPMEISLSESRRVGFPGVGNSPALMKSFPSSILCGYSKRPRSGGPDAREPSS